MIPSGYKEDVVYSQIPTDGSGDLSFTRASNGTRINSAGLVEVCPWNLLEQSNTFNASPWAMNVTSGQAGKDGQNNAWLLTKATATSSDYYNSNVYNGDQTFTIYVKKESGKGFKLYPIGTTTVSTEVNLQTGAVINQGAGITSTTVEAYSSTWWKISVALNMINSIYYIYVTDGAGTQIASSITIQDAQVNIGLTAKPYFPTTDRLNVPRLTYQNGGGGCPSLLLEKQSTNYCLWSNDLTQSSAWIDQSTNTTITQITSGGPDGGSFTRLVSTGSGSQGRIVQAGSITNPNSATMSVYLKGSGDTAFGLFIGNGISQYENVTLTNTWTRYDVTANGVGGTYQDWQINCVGGSTIDVSFVQVEEGVYATSPIPTTSSSATRVADACYRTGISSLIGQSQGTIFIDAVMKPTAGSYDCIMSVNDGGFTNSVNVFTNTVGDYYYEIYSGGAVQATQAFSTLPATRMKIAVAWNSTNSVVYVNGSLLYTSSAITTPSGMGSFNFSGPNNSYTMGKKEVNDFLSFTTKLTASELIALTTI
jgi:hypothetical protein